MIFTRLNVFDFPGNEFLAGICSSGRSEIFMISWRDRGYSIWPSLPTNQNISRSPLETPA